MPVAIQWRRSPRSTHFGSAEIKGGGAPPAGTIIFSHPLEPTGPRASPSAIWTYNHADASVTPVVAMSFDIVCSGHVSFDRYIADRAAYVAAGGNPSTFRGQEAADEIYPPAPAGYIQTSGDAYYEPWLVGPPGTRIGLSVMLYAFAVGMGAPNAQAGGGKVQSQASVCVGNGSLYARASAKLLHPLDSRQGGNGGAFSARIPASGELKLGSISAGVGFNISAGSGTFMTGARGAFSFFEGAETLPKIGCP
jgi:hypothetical protein